MHEDRPRRASLSLKSAALFSFALLLLFNGCKSAPATPEDDAALTQGVQGKLSSDTSLANEPIQASVQQGVATLSGTVSSEAARALAASDAAQVGGVRTVVNNLVVQPSTAHAAPPHNAIGIGREKPSRKTAAAKPPAEDAALPVPRAPVQTAQGNSPPPAEDAPLPAPPIHEPAPAQAPAAPIFRPITLDSGTTLAVRITQTLDSASTQQGQTFSGVLASDILSDGIVVLPQGTPVSGRVTAVKEAAHFKGNALLTVQLTSLDRKGEHLPIATDSYSKSGNGRGKNSAEKIGGGAAVGAILGGIFGGGKGAAIGAAAGGGAGAGVQGITKGQQVQIESETLLRFHLSSPITVRVATGNQSHGSQGDADLRQHQ